MIDETRFDQFKDGDANVLHTRDFTEPVPPVKSSLYLGDMIDLVEAGQISGYHPSSLSTRCKEGTLKGRKIGNKWFVTRGDLESFMANHRKHTHFDKPASDDTIATVPDLPWTDSERRSEGRTENDMNTWSRSARGVGFITKKLAAELRPIMAGESVRLKCPSKAAAKKLQSYVREAAYLAGWYNSIPNTQDWPKWAFWVSHVEPGTTHSSAILQVVRLREARPSKVVRKKQTKTVCFLVGSLPDLQL